MQGEMEIRINIGSVGSHQINAYEKEKLCTSHRHGNYHFDI